MIPNKKWREVFIPEELFFQEGPGVRNTQFRDSGVKLLNVGNINNGVINLASTKTHLSEEEAFGKYSHFLVDEGDLLIACSGIIVDNFHNKIAFATSEHLPLCLNTSTMRFKPLNSESLNITFFKYYLQSEYFKSQLVKLITGSAQLNFGPSHIKKIRIKIPPLEDQKKIASILDAADVYRQKTKALIAKYDELTHSLFLDMFGDPVSNPNYWVETELINVAKTKNDVKCGPFGTQLSKSEYVESGVPVWGIPQINSNFKKKPTEYVTKSKAEELIQYSVKAGDIVMSRKGNVGACSLFASELTEGILHSDAIRIRVNQNIILPIVLSMQFKKSKVLQTQISNVSSGAIMAGINVSKLKNVIIQVPDLKIQSQFAERVQGVEKQKAQAQASLEKAEDLFNSLLQRAFKGELVKN